MTNSQKICPICDEGTLSTTSHKQGVSYKSNVQLLDGFMHSECSNCGAVITDSEQARNNKRIVIAYQKRIEGLLTGLEVRSVRKKLNLTQAEASKIFGGGPVAFSKYESDDVTQSEAMDKLIRLTSEVGGAMDYLSRTAGVEFGSARVNNVSKLFEAWRNRESQSYELIPDSPTFGRFITQKHNTKMNDTVYEKYDSEPAAA